MLVVITAVYVPMQANAKVAMETLQHSINQQLAAHPDCVIMSVGDFSHANLKSVLPRFFKNVSLPTRENNTLDQVYTNIPDANKATPTTSRTL